MSRSDGKKSNKIKARMTLMGLLLMLGLSGCGNKNTAYLAESYEAIENFDYSGALKSLEQAEEAGENIRLVERARGIAYLRLADYDKALECFEEALKGSNGFLQPVDYDINYYLAEAQTRSGRPEEAEETYNAILALKANEKNAYFLRGNVRLVLGKYSEAKEDFDKVVQLDPKNYDWLIEIYQAFSYYDYEEEGREYLVTALNNSGDDMDVYDVGRIYYYLEDYQKAYVALEEARSHGGASSYLYLGRAYEETGDYNYAASVYTDYLKGNDGNAQIYNQLGVCLMKKGEYQKALDSFQKGLELASKDEYRTLSFNQIAAYEFLGDFETAKELCSQYLRQYPDDPNALRENKFLSTR